MLEILADIGRNFGVNAKKLTSEKIDGRGASEKKRNDPVFSDIVMKYFCW